MKQSTLILALFTLIVFSGNAQKLRGLDKSPMDMAYYPDNFAHDRKFSSKPEWNDKALIRVTYSRPNKKERVVFGNLIPFGKEWRAGANESTEIKFYTDASINGKSIKAGVYSLFIIPNEKEWTIIFNTDLDQWGGYNYKAEKDILRMVVPVKQVDEVVENFTIQFRQDGNKLSESIMTLAWDKTKVEIPIKL